MKEIDVKYYIMVIRNTGYWLVGPFDTNEDAAKYGRRAQKRAWFADPRWQTIQLADPTVAPEIVKVRQKKSPPPVVVPVKAAKKSLPPLKKK